MESDLERQYIRGVDVFENSIIVEDTQVNSPNLEEENITHVQQTPEEEWPIQETPEKYWPEPSPEYPILSSSQFEDGQRNGLFHEDQSRLSFDIDVEDTRSEDQENTFNDELIQFS